MKLDPIAATSVGSFPRPEWLAKTDRGRTDFILEGEQLREGLDDAVALVLREQEELGMDLLTDGEQRRTNFIYHIASTWDGVDTKTLGEKKMFRNRVSPRLLPRITAPIKRSRPAAVADLRFAKAHTKSPVKMQVPGPMTVVDSTADVFYGDEAAMAMDVAAAINAELRDLQTAGCDVVQIDEPAMTRYHDKVRQYGAKALDRCLEGITIPTIVHLCYGYPGGVGLQYEYEYGDLLPNLMETRIGGFTVEFGRSGFDPKVLRACGDRLVMFGCIDPGDSPPPTLDSVKRRVGGALEHLDPRKVLLAPDCGLVTIPRALARAKLAVMVQAARELRKGL